MPAATSAVSHEKPRARRGHAARRQHQRHRHAGAVGRLRRQRLLERLLLEVLDLLAQLVGDVGPRQRRQVREQRLRRGAGGRRAAVGALELRRRGELEHVPVLRDVDFARRSRPAGRARVGHREGEDEPLLPEVLGLGQALDERRRRADDEDALRRRRDLQHHLPPLGRAGGIDLADAAEIEDDVALGAVGDLLAREAGVEIAGQLQVGRAPVDGLLDLELARAGVGRVVEPRRQERGDVGRHRHRRMRLQEREEGERIFVEVFGVAARLADALGQLAGACSSSQSCATCTRRRRSSSQ